MSQCGSLPYEKKSDARHLRPVIRVSSPEDTGSVLVRYRAITSKDNKDSNYTRDPEISGALGILISRISTRIKDDTGAAAISRLYREC